VYIFSTDQTRDMQCFLLTVAIVANISRVTNKLEQIKVLVIYSNVIVGTDTFSGAK
jgi:hypothetical protein